MIIAHNLPAMKAQKQMRRNDQRLSNVIEKLSSGLRINKAADDASGLAISEKMRAQIHGLSQASRNIQDGISLLQTAEGGLDSILEPPLQRLRALAVQAANDTLTDDDRKKIQAEVRERIKEIDGIAQNTQFNGMRLLAGTYLDSSSVNSLDEADTIPSLTQEWSASFANYILSMTASPDGSVLIAGGTNLPFASTEQNWLTKVDADGHTVWQKLLPLDNSYNYVFNVQALSDGSYVATTRRRRDVGYGMDEPVLYKFDADGNVVNTKVLYEDGYLFDLKQTSDGGYIATGNAYNNFIIQKLDANFNITATQSIANPPDAHFKTGIDVIETADHGYMVVGEETHTSYSDGFAMKFDSNLNQSWESKSSHNVFSSVVETNKGYMAIGDNGLYNIDTSGTISQLNTTMGYAFDNWDYKHDWLQQTADGNVVVGTATNVYKVNSSGDELWKLNFPSVAVAQTSDRGYVIATSMHTITKISPENNRQLSPKIKDGWKIQIGANADNNLFISINDVSTSELGIHGLSLGTRKEANSAIATIDHAIDKVSAERSKIGAYENALGYALNNDTDSEENLTSSESRIRDVDMAKSITEYTKLNILNQVNQSMLAHASQQPQDVLDLLK